MSELWLCREQTASRPFSVGTQRADLWNLEELCYFLYENAVSLEEGVVGEGLFQWIGEELKLPRLAGSLREYQKQGKSDVWCAWFFLQEIGLYREEELTELARLSSELEHRDEFFRRKLAADQLLLNEKYGRCIQAYGKLLQRKDAVNQDPKLLGDVWHDIGVAHARLFLFQEAADFFQTAYGLNQRPESQKAREDALMMQFPMAPPQEAEEPEDWGQALYGLREEYKKKVMKDGII